MSEKHTTRQPARSRLDDALDEMAAWLEYARPDARSTQEVLRLIVEAQRNRRLH